MNNVERCKQLDDEMNQLCNIARNLRDEIDNYIPEKLQGQLFKVEDALNALDQRWRDVQKEFNQEESRDYLRHQHRHGFEALEKERQEKESE